MKPIEIVALIKSESPELLGNIPDRRAAAIIRQALAQIARQVAEIDEGQLKMSGFGQFVIRQVAQKDGQPALVKKVMFRAASSTSDGREAPAVEAPAANPKKKSAKGGKRSPAKKKQPKTEPGLF